MRWPPPDSPAPAKNRVFGKTYTVAADDGKSVCRCL